MCQQQEGVCQGCQNASSRWVSTTSLIFNTKTRIHDKKSVIDRGCQLQGVRKVPISSTAMCGIVSRVGTPASSFRLRFKEPLPLHCPAPLQCTTFPDSEKTNVVPIKARIPPKQKDGPAAVELPSLRPALPLREGRGNFIPKHMNTTTSGFQCF